MARHEDFEGDGAMRVLENNYGWSPIDTAPFDEDVMLEVTDGQGEPYRLRNPLRTHRVWLGQLEQGTPLVVTPVRWKPHNPRVVRPRP